MRALLGFFRPLHSEWSTVWAMAGRELSQRYVGTLAGLVWTVVQPLLLILTYLFVFSVIRGQARDETTPFVVYFLSGFAAWMAFSQMLLPSVSCVATSPHLVKRTVFPTQVLPVVHLLVSLVTHGIMLVILLVMMGFLHREGLSLYNLQFAYYLAAMIVFGLGLSWALAALNVLYRDVAQVVGATLNIWFWLTPVVWKVDWGLQNLPGVVTWLVRANPLYYVINGYHWSFIEHRGFWCNWQLGLYYWAVALGAFVLGAVLFMRLKPEFPEVM